MLVGFVSVYVFHDVDQDKIGHWKEASEDLSIEAVVFSLIIGGAVGLLTVLARHLFHLHDSCPRARVGLSLGIAVTAFQYPCEFVVRKLVPSFAESFLYFYIAAAILFCAAVLLRDTSKQFQLRSTTEPPSTHLE